MGIIIDGDYLLNLTTSLLPAEDVSDMREFIMSIPAFASLSAPSYVATKGSDL